MLLLGPLYTSDTNENDDNDTNNDDNNTQQTNHGCIGSLAYMPNEPKRGLKTNLPHVSTGTTQISVKSLKSLILNE